MQWILLLVGLVLGGYLDESLVGAAIGALAGLGLGQAICMTQLGRQIEAVQQRLTLLEPAPGNAEAPTPAAQPLVSTTPALEAAPELTWDLPVNDEWTQPAATPNPVSTPAAPTIIERALAGARNWLLGAALIGVVVAKLFFVELSNRGGLARIVSFIGVGVLLLVVGYFSPLPPKPSSPMPLTSKKYTPDLTTTIV